MKIKKLIAAALSAAILGSAASVPVFAAEDTATVSASVAAQVRSNNAEWTSMHTNGSKIVTSGDIETSGISSGNPVYFSAFYYFDADSIPDGATIKSATIDMYQGSQPFSDKDFAVAAVEIPADVNDISSIWNSVSAVMSPNNAADTTVTATMQKLEDNKTRVMRADVTSIINSGADKFAFVTYNQQRDDGNRRLCEKATLTITYEYDDTQPETPTASIVENSVFTENGTGDYAEDVATGFIAEIKTTADSAAAAKLGVKVGNDDKGTRNITQISGGASAYYNVIINGINSADDVTLYVQ